MKHPEHDPLCQWSGSKNPQRPHPDLCRDCTLVARVVERERGRALADRDREWVEALAAVEMYSVEGYAEVWRQLLGPALAQFAEPHVSEFLSWAASLAAARPAEGTPE